MALSIVLRNLSHEIDNKMNQVPPPPKSSFRSTPEYNNFYIAIWQHIVNP